MLLALGDLGAEDEEEAEAAMMANWCTKLQPAVSAPAPAHEQGEEQGEGEAAVAVAMEAEAPVEEESEAAVVLSAPVPAAMEVEAVAVEEKAKLQPQQEQKGGQDVYALLGMSREAAEAMVRGLGHERLNLFVVMMTTRLIPPP